MHEILHFWQGLSCVFATRIYVGIDQIDKALACSRVLSQSGTDLAAAAISVFLLDTGVFLTAAARAGIDLDLEVDHRGLGKAVARFGTCLYMSHAHHPCDCFKASLIIIKRHIRVNSLPMTASLIDPLVSYAASQIS